MTTKQALTILGPTTGWNTAAGPQPTEVVEAAKLARDGGLDGMFSGDHVTFHGRGNDGLMNLAFVAAHVPELVLQTSVYLLALRHPTTVALQASLIDHLCGGRLILGVGIGGEDPAEWWACGIDPRSRPGRTDEGMQILRSLWTQEETTFQGRYYQLETVAQRPKPVRPEGIPLWVGGRSDAAILRGTRYGDGYIGIWISPRRFAELREKHDEYVQELELPNRPFAFGMQCWIGVDADERRAREKVAERMSNTYHLPFDRFERYVPYGTPQQVAERLMEYVEVGCTHVNIQPAESSPLASIESALAVRQALLRMVSAS
jgi:alkanesulfonate monooxygenase SsuD/methylene tetrahydromethanopterin reductase-like flavin-dependent oxidoreductase (luciferase family)